MRVLITGGSGFIGKNLSEAYRKKYTVFVPSHKELELTNFRAVEQYIKKNKIDAVIHCAIKGDGDVLETTLRMYLSILGNLSSLQKFIHFGSGAEYDKSRDLIKVKETHWGERIPKDPYGLAKYICSEISKNYNKIITLRLFGVYGKYEDYRFKFISNTIAKTLFGLPIIIKQDVVFDYLYITDLVAICDYFLTHQSPYPDYNIIPDRSIKISQLAQMIREISGKDLEISVKNKGENYEYTGDNKRLKRTISNLKFTPYMDSVTELYRYYQENMHLFDKNDLRKDKYLSASKVRK
ncbi:NAD-dependent epimerase/dehydratase family protein [Candidatus Gottesmanbacteria bacterium]|nr:NAD-dependent epimerase/dehydratase family protein [Candidatus Gottesmanbacteria bacterium]